MNCEHCNDKGMLRVEGTNILVPCLKCNEGGRFEVVTVLEEDVNGTDCRKGTCD